MKNLVWGADDYGLVLLYLAFTFFFTPIQINLLAIIGVFICINFTVLRFLDRYGYLIEIFDCRWSRGMDTKFSCPNLSMNRTIDESGRVNFEEGQSITKFLEVRKFFSLAGSFGSF